MALKRYWSFFGHTVRNSAQPVLWDLLCFRNDEWWGDNKVLPAKWRVCHRNSGNQISHVDELVREYCKREDL
eukprot:11754270-Karenia_brevis.AAC.1